MPGKSLLPSLTLKQLNQIRAQLVKDPKPQIFNPLLGVLASSSIPLGVALGSATQIGLFVVPLCVVVAWIMGIKMDLNFNLIETGSLALAIIATAFTLQDGTSHYMKGLILLLCYIVIGACFCVQRSPINQAHVSNMVLKSATDAVLSA